MQNNKRKSAGAAARFACRCGQTGSPGETSSLVTDRLPGAARPLVTDRLAGRGVPLAPGGPASLASRTKKVPVT